jgi:uncharacterized protein YdhG (YjbR/CyaY superfamily)
MPVANSVEAFLAGLPDDQRSALEHLRAVIRSTVPEATEGIGYGVPAFRLRGRPLVSYGAGKAHCSLYVQSPAVMEAHVADLAGFRTSKGTVTFTPDAPIPADLVRRLVLARVAELEERYPAHRR